VSELPPPTLPQQRSPLEALFPLSRSAPLEACSEDVNDKLDVLVAAAATCVCNIMPLDTLHCTIGGETWHAAALYAVPVINSVGATRRFVRFAHLSDCAPTSINHAVFHSPNRLLALPGGRCIHVTSIDRRNHQGDIFSDASMSASPRVVGCFISLYIEANCLISQVLSYYGSRSRNATSLSEALGAMHRSQRTDVGFLFLDYLFVVMHHGPSIYLDRAIDRLLDAYKGTRTEE